MTKGSYDPTDFDPSTPHERIELKLCRQCGRAFLNRWVFLRHRPEGRGAIGEPADPTVRCLSDRELVRRGMWRVRGERDSRDVWLWSDRGDVSPLNEVPGSARRNGGKGRKFEEGNRRSAHYQAEQRRKRERGSQN